MNEHHVREHLLSLARTAEEAAGTLAADVARAADMARSALEGGGTLFFCGNGGSAADAQHLAAEYVVRFARTRRALPAVALTVDTSILTAGGNDLGFDQVFARQVEALGRAGDVLFLHSTSGRSPNLLHAAAAARERGLVTVAFLARDGGPLRERVDLAVVVPTEVTATAQEIHLALGHAVCELVDRAFADGEAAGGDPTTVVEALAGLRRAEKAQTAWYRSLAARAEEEGDAEASERLNGLHADEQHHLSRLTARLLELGATPEELRGVAAPAVPAHGWEAEARRREAAEVAAYEAVLQDEVDSETRALLEEILHSERQHERTLGGKWMPA